MKRNYELVEEENYIELLENGKIKYFLKSDGYSYECTYDDKGNELTFKNSNGYSWEHTYDGNNKLLTETVNGKLTIDNRPKEKELTVKEISDLLGYKVKVIE